MTLWRVEMESHWLIPIMAFTIVPIAVLLLAVVVQILADIFG